MKVAVSIPDALYARADEAAARLGLNRSQLYARALTDLLADLGPDPVTERLDALAGEVGPAAGVATGRSLIDSGSWEW